VLLTHGKGNAGAEAFYDFAASPAAMQVFAKRGFIAAGKADSDSVRCAARFSGKQIRICHPERSEGSGFRRKIRRSFAALRMTAFPPLPEIVAHLSRRLVAQQHVAVGESARAGKL